MDVLFVSAQHDVPYFHWQVELYINNFIEKGIPIENIHTIFSLPNGAKKPTSGARSLQLKYPNIHFFEDNREKQHYIPSIKPFLISQWIKEDSRRGDCFFLHDSDILFNRLPNFSNLMINDINYLSNTIGYIGYEYIMDCSRRYKSKYPTLNDDSLLIEMSNVIGISPDIIKDNQNSSGGAQYLLKKQTYEIWDKIYKDSTNLYDKMLEFQSKYPISPGEIQFWTSEMWSILWNLWKYNYKTEIHRELNFSWATDTADVYEKCPIFHLAGVTESLKETKFYKGDFINKNPIELLKNDETYFNYVDKNSATFKYIQNIESFIKKQIM
jgi:hypothetical protein